MSDRYLPSTAYCMNYSKPRRDDPEGADSVGARIGLDKSTPEPSNLDALSSTFKCALCVRERDTELSEIRTFLGAEHRLCRICVRAVDRNRA